MRTVEEKKAWKSAMGAVAAKVRAMSPEEREKIALTCGTVTVEGRSLSPFNTVYLWMQAGRPLAQVGGFRQWQKAGRKVLKGQHAAGYIWVPLGSKKDDDDPKIHFRLVPVFDVEQTIEIKVAA